MNPVLGDRTNRTSIELKISETTSRVDRRRTVAGPFHYKSPTKKERRISGRRSLDQRDLEKDEFQQLISPKRKRKRKLEEVEEAEEDPPDELLPINPPSTSLPNKSSSDTAELDEDLNREDSYYLASRKTVPLESYVGDEGKETVATWMSDPKWNKPKEKRVIKRTKAYQLVSEYVNQFNGQELCPEAARADKFGSYKVTLTTPGFPTRKFSANDVEKYGSDPDKDWHVQGIYPPKNDNLSKNGRNRELLALYSGWTSETAQNRPIAELEKTAPDALREYRLRESIAAAIYRMYIPTIAINKKTRFRTAQGLWWKPDSSFWCFVDFEFFVNTMHTEAGLGPIYFILTNRMAPAVLVEKYPTFEYILKPVVDDEVLDWLRENDRERTVDRSMRKAAIAGVQNDFDSMSGCPSDDCMCRTRRDKLYAGHWLRYNRRGALILSNFHIGTVRFVIECSDICGCDDSCPTRQLQRGQQVPLAVFYEERKGFGVRAGCDIEKGQFIIEYLGILKKQGEKSEIYAMEVVIVKDRFDEDGDQELLEIDATKKGNISRYFNHSCDPNAFITEVHSRRSEDDLLVPRAGYYALKNIRKGEEITVSYYLPEALEKAAARSSNRTRCECRTAKCLGYLPK